jgi:hypothetical protein
MKQDLRLFCITPGVLLFTSGTTDLPKAVHYHYPVIHRYLLWCVEEFNLSKKDILLFTTELSFAASLRPLLLSVLSFAQIQLIPDVSPNKILSILKTIQDSHVTVLNMTPSVLNALLCYADQNGTLSSLKSIRLILLSGETISTDDINKWFTCINPDVVFYDLYGATECLIPFFKKITAPLKAEEATLLGQLRPFFNYQLETTKNNLCSLLFSGDIATAYLTPIKKQSSFTQLNGKPHYRSNDLVRLIDGKLHLAGRAEYLIKHYGQNINLNQVNTVLSNALSGKPCIVLYEGTPVKKIQAVIEARKTDLILKNITHALQRHLPKYMHPEQYHFLTSMPLTVSGKIDVTLLKITHLNTADDYLSELLSGYFKNKKINNNTLLSSLGLESIDYISLSQSILKNAGKWLDISSIHEHTTVKTLMNYLAPISAPFFSPSHSIDTILLNPVQYFGYFEQINQRTTYNPWYHCFYSLHEKIDIARLGRAVQDTIDAHFMLSCKLVLNNDVYFFKRVKSAPPIFIKDTFFSKQLKTIDFEKTVYSENLVTFYIYIKGNQKALIINFHHIALDGWSLLKIREEIFMRYAGEKTPNQLSFEKEVKLLQLFSQITKASCKNISPELVSIYNKIPSPESSIPTTLFSEPTEYNNQALVLSLQTINRFKKRYHLERLPNSVVFIVLLYLAIHSLTGNEQLLLFFSLANRQLPIPHITELISYFPLMMPLSILGEEESIQTLAHKINHDVDVIFKQTTYQRQVSLLSGGLESILPHEMLCSIKVSFTYINNLLTYDSVQNKYIDWSKSMNQLHVGKTNPFLFLRVHDMGSQFILHVNARMKKGLLKKLINTFHSLLD